MFDCVLNMPLQKAVKDKEVVSMMWILHNCFALITKLVFEANTLNYIIRFYVIRWTLSWRRPLSYRNQSTDLLHKSMDWFPYDNGLRHERVKQFFSCVYLLLINFYQWKSEKYHPLHFSHGFGALVESCYGVIFISITLNQRYFEYKYSNSYHSAR